MEEIVLNKIEWSAPEYKHKERTNDWFWTIGIITLIAFVLAFWFKNYLFSIFIFISGCCLILFSVRPPQEIAFSIETEGLTMGKVLHGWKDIKGFNIKKGKPYASLIIETKKYFLPVYTIPMPENLTQEVKESLLKVIPVIDTLDVSPSMIFMEKLGF